MPHFTYQNVSPSADLMQGDILSRTPQLSEIISKYHPYYIESKFTAYMVTTQSCDLVRRNGGRAATQYISMCAIKPFSNAFERELLKYQNELMIAANAISSKYKDRMIMFIERLCNNNHPEYFYLHEDSACGMHERSCAYLRSSISVKVDHYSDCLEARKLSLSDTFQAKFGWLIGNLFSRVGTDDWAPHTKSAGEWKEFLNSVLIENVAVIDEKKVEIANKTLVTDDIDSISRAEMRQKIENIRIRKKKDDVIDVFLDQLFQDNIISTSGDREKLRKRLSNNAALAALVK